MLKKQLITIGAVLCILLSGGCISMAVHDAYKEHHPPPPSTTTFAELSKMKVLKIEVVDETKDKRFDAGELASAIVVALHKEPAISNHSHVSARVDDQVPADGKLIVHLTDEDSTFNEVREGRLNSNLRWKIGYRIQFVSGEGITVSESKSTFNHIEYFKKNDTEKFEANNPWTGKFQKKYEKELSEQIIREFFVN